MISIVVESGIKTNVLKTGRNQTNQIQFEKRGGNNKVGNYNPAKAGSFMPALTLTSKELPGLGCEVQTSPSHRVFFAIIVYAQRPKSLCMLRSS